MNKFLVLIGANGQLGRSFVKLFGRDNLICLTRCDIDIVELATQSMNHEHIFFDTLNRIIIKHLTDKRIEHLHHENQNNNKNNLINLDILQDDWHNINFTNWQQDVISKHIIAVINVSAYTKVDLAESNQDIAHLTNTIFPYLLAKYTNLYDIYLFHYSTDYVFGDTELVKFVPRNESDTTYPINIYGKSKLDGENLIQAIDGKYIIFRVSWLYSEFGNNFVDTIIRLINNKDKISVIYDQIGSPTYCVHIVWATYLVLEQLFNHKQNKSIKGIYHLCNSEYTSWFEFAQQISLLYNRRVSEKQQKPRLCNIEAIKSEEYRVIAKRPHNSMLNTKKIREDFGIIMPSWIHAIDECIKIII